MRIAIEANAVLFLIVFLLANAATAQSAGSGQTPSIPRYGNVLPNTLPPTKAPLRIHAGFELQVIDEIDDESETFGFTGVLTFSWRDPRQAFDPRVEGMEERIYIGGYQFNEVFQGWWPQVMLVNEAGEFESDGVMLRVRPDGSMTLTQAVNAVARTTLNLRRVPFDRQRLEATFQVVGFDKDEVVFRTGSDDGGPTRNPDEQFNVPQWRLAGIHLTTAERVRSHRGHEVSVSTFVVGIDVERQPLFFVRLVIGPMIVMVMLSWTVFWMEKSSLGDRTSVSFIGILTAVAYQMMLDDSLPQISYVTMLNGFLTFSFLLMCSSVLVNLRVSALDRQGRIDDGDRLDQRCRWLFPLVYVALMVVLFVVPEFLPAPH